MKEKTRLNIYYAVRLYKSGIRDRIALSNKLKISTRTLLRWKRTDLWESLMEDYEPKDYRIPCERKNIAAYYGLKEIYFKMRIDERNRISLLVQHPECNVSDKTLRTWRRHWKTENTIKVTPIS